jgi:hypothetical protein
MRVNAYLLFQSVESFVTRTVLTAVKVKFTYFLGVMLYILWNIYEVWEESDAFIFVVNEEGIEFFRNVEIVLPHNNTSLLRRWKSFGYLRSINFEI